METSGECGSGRSFISVSTQSPRERTVKFARSPARRHPRRPNTASQESGCDRGVKDSAGEPKSGSQVDEIESSGRWL
ncbi:hypothetical protein J5N97_028211 [Dioscorea zingiberensis]|uniref:Uncharacterized protein n=1 Tax=Dioscorea zingiberensis TaxID=325984 RepID=A0A9D5BYN3_9LILI|nr:hypothetical protein J5N97_028211 [Dioscorea zingiberensis]